MGKVNMSVGPDKEDTLPVSHQEEEEEVQEVQEKMEDLVEKEVEEEEEVLSP